MCSRASLREGRKRRGNNIVKHWMQRVRTWSAVGLIALTGAVVADPYPPTLGTAHFPPVAWPADPAILTQCGAQCGGWLPYTRFQSGVADPRVQDPSNGGTAPQNYVNISSSCIDKSYPSIYYHLKQGPAQDGSEDVIMFRWRVEQIANTYATGPSAGAYGASDPWSSALWSVLFDVDGDGYLDLAAHLDGSSGSPAYPIDRIAGIWSKRPTQSLDYLNDPTNVKLLAHNPTAFTDGSGKLLNFSERDGQNQPLASWPNGSSETIWDYGTTRAKRVTSSPCNEYFIDYQIPVKMLDASSQGGPKVTRSTPISMVFCTANSLNNPFQKDCAINAAWTGASAQPAPFGDYISFNQTAPYAQPIVSAVEAIPPNTCPGNYTLNATVQDTLAVINGAIVPSVQSVRFFYYYDANGNGLADDGNAWTFAADGSLKPGSLNRWTASWNGAGLPKGAYLIGVQALDDNTKVDLGVTPSGINNRTFSYVAGDAENRINVGGQSYATLPTHSPAMTLSGENWWGNPSVTGSQVALVGLALNACGQAPTLTKSGSTANVAAGGVVDYIFTVANTQTQPLTLDRVVDVLPDGFSVVSTTPGTLSPTSSPANGATGSVTWNFSPAVTLGAGTSGSFSFRAQASSVAGQYNNTATAVTSFGSLSSAPVPVAVDGVRLSFSKTPSTYQATPDGATVLTYTLRYANDSTVAVTSAQIVDTLPAGVAYASCGGGSACGISGGTVTWTLGTLAGGASGSVQLGVTVNSGYAGSSLTNTANLQGLDPAGGAVSQSASATVSVPVAAASVPAFSLSKTADIPQVSPGANVVWTLSYSNYGNAAASNVTLSDALPPGFTYVACSGGCSVLGSTVSWTWSSVAAGASGSVTVTAKADNPFTAVNPATNSASLNWTGNTGGAVTASVQTGVTGQSCSKYYFRNQSTNVGAIAGTQLIANQLGSAPTGVGASKKVTVPASSSGYVTALEFYTDPVTASSVDFNGAITSYIYVDRANGPGLVVKTEVFDYNVATGALTAIGTASSITMNGSTKGLVRDGSSNPPTFNATGTLQKGHRLLFRYSVTSANTQTYDVYLQFDGNAVANPISTGSTDAPSRGEFCVTPPPNLAFSKTVNQSTVNAGVPTAVQYTLAFSNTGQTKATGVQIVDTLPTGVSFVSATLNGAAITPSQAGQQLTFLGIQSTTDGVAGEVSGGKFGTLVINATVQASATGTLTNTAAISSNQTEPNSASAVTYVQGGAGSGTPQLSIQLAADRTSAVPGDTVTYTVTVANIGTASANSVVLVNPIPVRSYYTYGTCSGSCTVGGGNLQWSIPSLAVGTSVSYTFTMQAGSSGLPAGVSVVPDQANATATSVAQVDSNTVNVSISGNPQLTLSKQATGVPAPAPAPGQTFTYELQVRNAGNSDAKGVVVVDPIPSGASFAEGLTASVGTGGFDSVNNRVVFQVGTLAPGATATLTFLVKVGALPAGNTNILNTASATAQNAPGVSATALTTASALPQLTLTKQAPQQLPSPVAILAQAVSNSTTLRVNDATQISLGQYLSVGGAVARVMDMTVNSVLLDAPVTATAGTLLQSAITYSLTYENSGTASAVSASLTDALPTGTSFVTASHGGVHSNGVVTWSLGTLDPKASGSVTVVVLPSGAGTYVNQASINCTGCAVPVAASATTSVGGLVVSKRTTTPVVAAGAWADYVIDVRNTSALDIGGVTVTDVLSSGFTYDSTLAVMHDGVAATAASQPSPGAGTLAWGTFTVAAGKTLSVTFRARVSADAGSGTYQNEASATPANRTVPYDFLRSTAEDVVVLGTDVGLVSGVVFQDLDNNGVFDAAVDLPLSGVPITITDGGGQVYEEVTSASGFYSRVLPLGTWSVRAGPSGIPGGLSLGGTFSNPASITLGAAQARTVNMGYVNASALPDLTVSKTHTGNFSQGQVGAQYSLVVRNQGQGPTAGNVTVVDTLPAGLTATAITGTGWTCDLAALSCTRADALAAGGSYPTITVTVNVAANAAAQVTNQAAVSGGGETQTGNNSASDVTNIQSVQLVPDLTLTKTHVGNFTQGQTGAVYTITVRNVGTGPTSGTVTVSDQLPAGLTATAISGSGWTCALAPLGCTRSDALASGASYPAVSVVVSVGAVVAASVTNVAVVSGGGDVSSGNNSASDVTTIASCSCIVAGHVYLDSNRNRIQEAGEPNFANVQLTLQEVQTASSGVLRAGTFGTKAGSGSWTVMTDGNGDFMIALPGVTQVRLFIAPPPGYALTTANDGQLLNVGQPLAAAGPMGLVAGASSATAIPTLQREGVVLMAVLLGVAALVQRRGVAAAAARLRRMGRR